MPKTEHRSFSREFKLKTLERIERGETVAAVSQEIGVHRQLIYIFRGHNT